MYLNTPPAINCSKKKMENADLAILYISMVAIKRQIEAKIAVSNTFWAVSKLRKLSMLYNDHLEFKMDRLRKIRITVLHKYCMILKSKIILPSTMN
jgi:hypothetical protein